MLICIYKVEIHKIKGNIQFSTLNVYLKQLKVALIYANECHFLISITRKVRKNKMITMYLRTFKMKTLLFIVTKPPFFENKEVDTQQLNISCVYYTTLVVYLQVKHENIIKNCKFFTRKHICCFCFLHT